MSDSSAWSQHGEKLACPGFCIEAVTEGKESQGFGFMIGKVTKGSQADEYGLRHGEVIEVCAGARPVSFPGS